MITGESSNPRWPISSWPGQGGDWRPRITRLPRHIFVLIVCLWIASLTAACSSATQKSSLSQEHYQATASSLYFRPTPTTTLTPPASSASTLSSPTPERSPVAASSPTPQPTLEATQPPATETPSASIPSPSPTASPSLGSVQNPDSWQTGPVIPTISDTAREIYQHGLTLGRNPHAFSKVGDCQSITTYFLSYFDKPGYFSLGEYMPLLDTIDWFSGSFKRESLAVRGGLNAAAVLSPLRADPKNCQKGESPLACELRANNPAIAIISLEEAWSGEPEKYADYMRQVLNYTISQGVVPVIATKADNLEGRHEINTIIAKLAWEYDIPLWNFWVAVQPLPAHGLLEDGFHLTHSPNYFFFDDPQALKSGWAMRNLTALQVLDTLRRDLLAAGR